MFGSCAGSAAARALRVRREPSRSICRTVRPPRAARGGLTVRQIERLGSRRARSARAVAEPAQDPNIREALDELQRHLGTKIHLREKTRIRPGQLVVEFYDQAQLMGIYDRLMK